MTRRTASPRRAAFTLVEVLVVVVIIALLASLLLVAINKVAKVGANATATSDISGLNTACEAFKKDWGFFPPSGMTVVNPTNGVSTPVYFKIPTTVPPLAPANLVQAQEKASFELYKKKYPRWLATATPGVTPTGLAGAGLELNGNQAMVYFLSGPAQTGWATDVPAAPSTTATAVIQPYFDFKTDRLAPGNTFGAPSAAVVFLDTFKTPTAPNGTPFAYLASVEGGRYVPHHPTVGNITCFGVAPMVERANNPVASTAALGAGVVKYLNPGGVQIISAGEDSKFGPGCPLTAVGTNFIQCYFTAGGSNPTGGISPYGEGDDGANDLGNFNNGNKLGVGK